MAQIERGWRSLTHASRAVRGGAEPACWIAVSGSGGRVSNGCIEICLIVGDNLGETQANTAYVLREKGGSGSRHGMSLSGRIS